MKCWLLISIVLFNIILFFPQEEKVKLGMLRVHSDKFCWKKTKATGVLVAKLEMGDFQAVKTVMRVLF